MNHAYQKKPNFTTVEQVFQHFLEHFLSKTNHSEHSLVTQNGQRPAQEEEGSSRGQHCRAGTKKQQAAGEGPGDCCQKQQNKLQSVRR